MFENFIAEYGTQIIWTLLVGACTIITAQAKKIYEKYCNTKDKKEQAEIVVKAVEQMYKSFKGSDKFDIAKTNLCEILNNKGIPITELELEMLIEACVCELNLSNFTNDKETENANNTVG